MMMTERFTKEMITGWKDEIAYVTENPKGRQMFVSVFSGALDEIERLQEEKRWIPVSERLPEVGEIVSWTHPSWKRTKEGYMTDSGRLKVWGGEYLKIDKMKWQPKPQPPKDGE